MSFLPTHNKWTNTIKKIFEEFPGGLIVRIPGFHSCGPGSIPAQETEIPHSVHPPQKKKERKKIDQVVALRISTLTLGGWNGRKGWKNSGQPPWSSWISVEKEGLDWAPMCQVWAGPWDSLISHISVKRRWIAEMSSLTLGQWYSIANTLQNPSGFEPAAFLFLTVCRSVLGLAPGIAQVHLLRFDSGDPGGRACSCQACFPHGESLDYMMGEQISNISYSFCFQYICRASSLTRHWPWPSMGQGRIQPSGQGAVRICWNYPVCHTGDLKASKINYPKQQLCVLIHLFKADGAFQ